MSVTIHGLAASGDGLPRWVGQRGTVTESCTIESYAAEQPATIPLDLEHDQQLGRTGRTARTGRGSRTERRRCRRRTRRPRRTTVSVGHVRREGRRGSLANHARRQGARNVDRQASRRDWAPRVTDHGRRPAFSTDRASWPLDLLGRNPLLSRAVLEHCDRHGIDPMRVVDRRRPSITTADILLDVPSPFTRLEFRHAAVEEVRFDQRIVEVVAAPYDVDAVVQSAGRMIVESIAPGSFDGVERRANRVKVNRDHDVTRTCGRVVALHPARSVGLVAELKIGRSVLGDETLALCEDGILDAPIGFAPMPGGEHTRTTVSVAGSPAPISGMSHSSARPPMSRRMSCRFVALSDSERGAPLGRTGRVSRQPDSVVVRRTRRARHSDRTVDLSQLQRSFQLSRRRTRTRTRLGSQRHPWRADPRRTQRAHSAPSTRLSAARYGGRTRSFVATTRPDGATGPNRDE